MKIPRRGPGSPGVSLLAMAICVLSLGATASGQITVTVYGQSNIYGSGYAVAPDPGGGGGGVLPTLVTVFNLFQSPPFIDVTLPFSLPVAASLSAQMVIVAPYMPTGLAFSQPTRLIVQ